MNKPSTTDEALDIAIQALRIAQERILILELALVFLEQHKRPWGRPRKKTGTGPVPPKRRPGRPPLMITSAEIRADLLREVEETKDRALREGAVCVTDKGAIEALVDEVLGDRKRKLHRDPKIREFRRRIIKKLQSELSKARKELAEKV